MHDVFWPGLAAVVVLYLLVFVVGLLASRGNKDPDSVEELMLAGRSLPLWVGLLTMTATWVGGGYINGTAEYTFTSGVAWGMQAGVGYALSLVLGGLVFARVMRRHGFATLVDPLEDRYGTRVAALLMLPAVLAELLWSAAILVALGTTVHAVLGFDSLSTAIMVSSGVAVAYTVFGGMRAVAYTDVVQMVLIVGGLAIAIPSAVAAAGGWGAVVEAGKDGGFSDPATAWFYGDYLLLFILGGIPWNVYFQRVLSCPDEVTAQRLSLGAGALCLVAAVPPMVLGLCASAMDWEALAGAEVAAQVVAHPSEVLALLLRHTVSPWVGVVGLGAVSAAVMSSVDSSILSASSLLAWNGYKRLLAPQATDREVTRVVKVLIVVLGVAATGIALSVQSIAALWFLCGDLVYTVLFPQLSLALFDRRANRSGAVAGLVVSTMLRLGGGVEPLGIPGFLYPDPGEGIDFPFRTLAMVCGLATAVCVSRLTQASDPPRVLVVRGT
jgi:solute carrier family 5 (high affinity choline transporter), member 7